MLRILGDRNIAYVSCVDVQIDVRAGDATRRQLPPGGPVRPSNRALRNRLWHLRKVLLQPGLPRSVPQETQVSARPVHHRFI